MTEVVYLVSHVRDVEGDIDEKFIGVFADQASASAAVSMLCRVEGFRDYPEGFVTTPFELDARS
jgi:hypothetical protein